MNQMNQIAAEDTPAAFRETVRILKLDDFCREHNIERIAFLKIDVEGFELEVIRGSAGMLESKRIQSIVAEVTFSRSSTQHVHFDDVRGILEPYGFSFTGYYDPAYRRENGQVIFTNALFSLSGD